MKKNILAIAIATAVAAPAAMADAKIYGYFNTAIQNVSDNGTKFDNRNSRIGFKGSEDLGNGLKAVYQFETGVDVNKGNWNETGPGKRNTYLGLAGNFGTVLMGRHDTPLRMIQPTDHFADASHAGTNRSVFQGGGGYSALRSGETRLDNVLAYISPSFNGVSFALAGAQMATDDDASPANGISASVSYGKKSDGIYVAAAMTKVSADAGLSDDATLVRVTAQYRADGLTANLMYTASDFAGPAAGSPAVDHNSITLGFAYDMDAITPKAKIARVDSDVNDNDWINMAIGLDYKLGKNTKAFVEYTKIDDDATAGVTAGSGNSVFAVGMNHKF